MLMSIRGAVGRRGGRGGRKREAGHATRWVSRLRRTEEASGRVASASTARRTGDTRLQACQSIYGLILGFSQISSLRAHRQTFAEPDRKTKAIYSE